ncbi:MAG: hypothetical protein JWO13_3112 [Acidobacteriales bacterium]|nr:hypothetical protein [Terriglobales bacterium]
MDKTLEHLNDDQWQAWLAKDFEDATDAHLSSCAECRQEGVRLRSLLAGFQNVVQDEAAREEAFWTRQRASIVERAMQKRTAINFAKALPFVAALALLVFAVELPKQSVNPPQTTQSNDDKDEALLRQIQGDAYREVPSALAPAGLVTEERERAIKFKKK